MSEDSVGIPPRMRQSLKQILAHAASQERTVVEFRTEEVGGKRHFSTALDITEYVEILEEASEEVPDR